MPLLLLPLEDVPNVVAGDRWVVLLSGLNRKQGNLALAHFNLMPLEKLLLLKNSGQSNRLSRCNDLSMRFCAKHGPIHQRMNQATGVKKQQQQEDWWQRDGDQSPDQSTHNLLLPLLT